MGRIGSSAGVYVIVYLLDGLLLATQEDFGLEGQSGLDSPDDFPNANTTNLMD